MGGGGGGWSYTWMTSFIIQVYDPIDVGGSYTWIVELPDNRKPLDILSVPSEIEVNSLSDRAVRKFVAKFQITFRNLAIGDEVRF